MDIVGLGGPAEGLRFPACYAAEGLKGPDPEPDVAWCSGEERGAMVSLRWDVGVGDPRSVLETGLGQSEAGLLSRRPIVRMKTPRPGMLGASVIRLRRPLHDT